MIVKGLAGLFLDEGSWVGLLLLLGTLLLFELGLFWDFGFFDDFDHGFGLFVDWEMFFSLLLTTLSSLLLRLLRRLPRIILLPLIQQRLCLFILPLHHLLTLSPLLYHHLRFFHHSTIKIFDPSPIPEGISPAYQTGSPCRTGASALALALAPPEPNLG